MLRTGLSGPDRLTAAEAYPRTVAERHTSHSLYLIPCVVGGTLSAYTTHKPRISLQPVMITDHRNRVRDFLREISNWAREGRIKHREHVVEDLDITPNTFIDRLDGRNFGRVVIRLTE